MERAVSEAGLGTHNVLRCMCSVVDVARPASPDVKFSFFPFHGMSSGVIAARASRCRNISASGPNPQGHTALHVGAVHGSLDAMKTVRFVAFLGGEEVSFGGAIVSTTARRVLTPRTVVQERRQGRELSDSSVSLSSFGSSRLSMH